MGQSTTTISCLLGLALVATQHWARYGKVEAHPEGDYGSPTLGRQTFGQLASYNFGGYGLIQMMRSIDPQEKMPTEESLLSGARLSDEVLADDGEAEYMPNLRRQIGEWESEKRDGPMNKSVLNSSLINIGEYREYAGEDALTSDQDDGADVVDWAVE